MSLPTAVTVSTPSRLHFGLFPATWSNAGVFGGCGLMVESPRTVIRLHLAPRTETDRIDHHRADEILQHWLAIFGSDDREKFDHKLTKAFGWKLDVLERPPEHVGLGTGTQLTLAVAAAMFAATERPPPKLQDIASKMGRGARSLVGTIGFARGGVVTDWGDNDADNAHTLTAEGLDQSSIQPPFFDSRTAVIDVPQCANDGAVQTGPRVERLEFPSEWRVVLVTDSVGIGLHGHAERSAFDSQPNCGSKIRHSMAKKWIETIRPALIAHDYSGFAEAIYEFGVLSGASYRHVQPRDFCNDAVASLARSIREFGVPAVVQSSWGPTIAAIVSSRGEAEMLVKRLIELGVAPTRIILTKGDNLGAQTEVAFAHKTEAERVNLVRNR